MKQHARQSVATTVAAFAAALALSLSGTAHAAGPTHTGVATDDATVTVNAIEDDLGLSTCAGKNPLNAVESLTAPEATVPATLLGGTAECGKTITVTATTPGPHGTRATRSVQAVVVDDCPSCAGTSNIDLSVSAFEALGNPPNGTTNVAWSFN